MQHSLRALFPVVCVFLGLLGVMWWGFDTLLDHQAHPNRNLAAAPGASGPVVLEAGSDGHYRAPGTINGHDVRFLVDTGASLVAIPEARARGMNIRRGPRIEVETAAGRARAYLTRLESVVIGGIAQHDVRAAIVPRMGDTDVLLGMSFLRNMDISQRDNKLVLKQIAVQ